MNLFIHSIGGSNFFPLLDDRNNKYCTCNILQKFLHRSPGHHEPVADVTAIDDVCVQVLVSSCLSFYEAKDKVPHFGQ